MKEGDEAPFPLEWPHKVSEIKKVLKIEKFPDRKIYLERQKGRERTKESVGLCQTNVFRIMPMVIMIMMVNKEEEGQLVCQRMGPSA